VAYEALKAELAKPKSKSGAKPTSAAASASATVPASTVGPASADPSVDNPSDDPISAGDPAMPLPDRKPQ
jgi:hypothetical protein